MNDVNEKRDEIVRKFKPVHREFDLLEDKIFKKEGFIFKTHKFKQEELMSSAHHRKIDSITRKIGSDISYWEMNGRLTADEKRVYLDEREHIDDVLHELNRKIENREPTIWEVISMEATVFLKKIMKNLPLLGEMLTHAGKLLGKIPYIGPMFPLLITAGQRATKLLK